MPDPVSPTPSNSRSELSSEPLNYREHFTGKHVVTKFVDPCEEAAKASMDCLDRNDYDRVACRDFFVAYRDCKKTWMDQRREDRRAGRPSSIDVQKGNKDQ